MIRRRLLTGAASNCAAKVVGVSTWFLLTPYVLDRLGPAAYALWVLMGALASYGFLLDFGIGGAVVKYVAEHTARGEREAARSFIASAAWLHVAVGLAALGAGVGLAPSIPGLIGVAPDQQASAVWIVRLTALNVAITLALTPWFSILKGLQRYDLYNAVGIGHYFVEAAAIVSVLLADWGVVGMVAVLAPVKVSAGLACAAIVGRVAPDLRIAWKAANAQTMRRIASFSGSLFAIDLAGRLQTKTDEFVIAAFRMLPLVTPYALARKLGELAQVISIQVLKVVMPLASALDASQERDTLRSVYVVSSRVALAIAVPLTLTLMFLGGSILRLWVGDEYAAQAPIVAVLALATMLATSQWPAVEVLQGMARHRLVAGASLGAGIANLTLSVLLLPRLGLIGVALGTLIPAMVAWIGIVMPYAWRIIGVPARRAARDIWLPAFVPGAGAAAVLALFQRQTVAPGVPEVGAAIALACLVYGAGYLSMPAAVPERRLVADAIAGGSRRLKELRPMLTRMG